MIKYYLWVFSLKLEKIKNKKKKTIKLFSLKVDCVTEVGIQNNHTVVATL
jgi:hypothetical protein